MIFSGTSDRYRSLVGRAVRVYREEGFLSLINTVVPLVYDDRVRPHLPRYEVTYNGVPVKAARRLDAIIPWKPVDIPNYEGTLLEAVREVVHSDDDVAVIGGGWGVSTVVAARHAVDGHVTVFEGSQRQAKYISETIVRNDCEDNVTVNHAIVGTKIALMGDAGDAPVVSTDDLPEADVIVMDCEGAEREILPELDHRPHAIVVETHGMRGAPTNEIREILVKLGYTVTDRGVAEPRLRDYCEENDVRILLGFREQVSP